jgi:hypothetical protein
MRNVHLITKEQEGADVLHQYLYITNDEEIKEGDWILPPSNIPVKYDGQKYKGDEPLKCWKKIILTTDPDLIADGVQAIDNEFLEWFVKNPSCERVKLDSTCKCLECGSSVKSSCEYAYKCRPRIFYKIIIPQEEPNKTHYLDELPNMDKKVLAKMWESAMPKLEPKQESHICKYCDAETTQLDDECYAKPKQETLEDFIRRESKSGNESVGIVKGVIWQAERMYSEEEAKTIWKAGQEYWKTSGASITFEELTEKFKKK